MAKKSKKAQKNLCKVGKRYSDDQFTRDCRAAEKAPAEMREMVNRILSCTTESDFDDLFCNDLEEKVEAVRAALRICHDGLNRIEHAAGVALRDRKLLCKQRLKEAKALGDFSSGQ